MHWNDPQTIYGMKVIVSPDHPKMQLSERVCEVLAPDFIAETNAWMLSFFGTYNVIEDDKYVVVEAARTVYMNPRTYQRLRALNASFTMANA